MREEWRDIRGHKGRYQVSNLGRVRSLPHRTFHCNGYWHPYAGGLLRPGLGVKGYYLTVALCRDGRMKTHYIHDLVAGAFLGHKPRGLDVLHGPGGSKNNKVSNLRYGTRSENHLEKYRDGTMNIRAVRRSDGKIFPSLKIAAEATGLCKWGSGICHAINGRAATAGGYRWRYINA